MDTLKMLSALEVKYLALESKIKKEANDLNDVERRDYIVQSERLLFPYERKPFTFLSKFAISTYKFLNLQ